jgi:hypothetical protein
MQYLCSKEEVSMKIWKNKLLSKFLRQIEAPDDIIPTYYEWEGWTVVIRLEGLLDQWYSMAVKRVVNERLEGAWTRINPNLWEFLTELDKREIFRILTKAAVTVEEWADPPETEIKTIGEYKKGKRVGYEFWEGKG